MIAEFVYYFIAKGGFNVRFADAETKELSKKIKELKKAGQPLKNLQRHAKKSMQSSGLRHLQSRAGCA